MPLPLGSRAHHLPRAEDESGCPGLSYSHNDGSETLEYRAKQLPVSNDANEHMDSKRTFYIIHSFIGSFTFGLYSAFLARSAIVFRSNLQPKLTVDTIFLHKGKKTDVAVGQWGGKQTYKSVHFDSTKSHEHGS